MMTVSKAAEKILGLISKHPGLSHGDISRALSMRRQTRQRAMRLLMESGRIFGTLGTDRKTLEWGPREPHRAEPVSEPRHEPASKAVTLSAAIELLHNAAPGVPAAALPVPVEVHPTVRNKSPFDMTGEEWAAAFGDGLGFGSPT